MTPTIPLDLFPLDGPARILRWGPLLDSAGNCWWPDEDVLAGVIGRPPIPLRGTALDAVLRSTAAALTWPITEDDEPPVLARHGGLSWRLSWRDLGVWFCPVEKLGNYTIPAFAKVVPYPAAVAAVALAVAGRGGE